MSCEVTTICGCNILSASNITTLAIIHAISSTLINLYTPSSMYCMPRHLKLILHPSTAVTRAWAKYMSEWSSQSDAPENTEEVMNLMNHWVVGKRYC